MSKFIKKLFGTLTQKPWEKEQAAIDSLHEGKTFNISAQKSAVIIIFGVATVLFSLIFTGYLLHFATSTRYKIFTKTKSTMDKYYNSFFCNLFFW